MLVEKGGDGGASGHCEHFAPVRLQHDAAPIGAVVTARIIGATDSELVGRLAA